MRWGRIAIIGVVCVALLWLAKAAWTTDWYAYRPAEPPDEVGTIDPSMIKLQSVKLGSVDALNQTVEFTWSQQLPIKVAGECDLEKVRPDYGQLSRKERSQVNQEQDARCKPSIFVQVYRKSSLGDGSLRVTQVGSGADVDKNGKLKWEGKLWIPHIPGRYLVRVTQMCAGRNAEASERILGTFYLQVIPKP